METTVRPFDVLKRLVDSSLDSTNDRIQKELNLLEEAPDFIPESFLKAYQHIVLEGNPAKPINECHSLIAYDLGISTFHPGKVSFHYPVKPDSLPDIDCDFADNHAAQRYVAEKYGSDRVIGIGTYGKYKFKGLLKDITRLIKDETGERIVSFDEVNALNKKLDAKIDNKVNRIAPAPGEEEEEEEDYSFDNEDIQAFKLKFPSVFARFADLYGIPKYAGKHAAGVLVLPEPASNLLPMRVKDGVYCSEWVEGEGARELGKMGAIKIDLLGLKTLKVLATATDLVLERHNPTPDDDSPCACKEEGISCYTNYKLPFIDRVGRQVIDIDNLCLNIPEIYNTISNGHTEGVFQLEPRGITGFCKDFEPREFYDIVLITSLWRPGAMDAHLDQNGIPLDPGTAEYKNAPGAHLHFIERRHGRQKVIFSSPKLKEVLGRTFGIAVFQEDISRIIMAMTGTTFAEAEKVRKYLTKVKPENLKKDEKTKAEVRAMAVKFVDDSVAHGSSVEEGKGVWNVILPFARYGFNKAHAVSYSIISYATAFFRTFYPLEYFVALLTHNVDKEEKLVEYIRTMQKIGYRFKKPNINTSMGNFSITDKDGILCGFEMIKGVGEKAIATIVENRETEGKFKSVEDFLSRPITWRVANIRVLEALVKAGAFDDLEKNRRLAWSKIAVAKGQMKKSEFETIDIFTDDDEDKNDPKTEIYVEDWDATERGKNELEVYGFSFRDNLTENYAAVEDYFKQFQMVCLKNRTQAAVGTIEDLRIFADKNKNNMAMITVKDLAGNKVKWVMFASIFKQFGTLLQKHETFFANGKNDPENNSFICDGIRSLAEVVKKIKKAS